MAVFYQIKDFDQLVREDIDIVPPSSKNMRGTMSPCRPWIDTHALDTYQNQLKSDFMILFHSLALILINFEITNNNNPFNSI